MTIAPVAMSDVDALLDRIREFLEEQTRLEIAFTPRPGWQAGCRTLIEKVTVSDNYFLDVVKDAGALAAFHLYGFTDEPLFAASRQGYIADLYVAPAFRRRGWGRRMVQHALDRLRQKGVHFVQLNVLLTNPGAFQFWRAIGFHEQFARMKIDLCDLGELARTRGA